MQAFQLQMQLVHIHLIRVYCHDGLQGYNGSLAKKQSAEVAKEQLLKHCWISYLQRRCVHYRGVIYALIHEQEML